MARRQVFRDDAAGAVRVDRRAEQVRHRVAQSRGAGQHEFAELDDVRIGCCATSDAVGVRYRAHNPKP